MLGYAFLKMAQIAHDIATVHCISIRTLKKRNLKL